ncbi:Uncharacterised protein [Yersinia mollaretii]|uniref:Uncharacterized protein n=1 Tax=Yersinia mollaretii TaxID=33060 RepID=A0AA36LLI8_YERMO|nr:Uncharacterised protein [Yersinia mollaretii]CNH99428.1 Uncharacterised protein [Yersinia mollaretii]CQJ10092.1 Uncharacterised protein [Yersinia mollaretii]
MTWLIVNGWAYCDLRWRANGQRHLSETGSFNRDPVDADKE